MSEFYNAPPEQLSLNFEVATLSSCVRADATNGSNVVQVEFGLRSKPQQALVSYETDRQTSQIIEQVLQSARKLSW